MPDVNATALFLTGLFLLYNVIKDVRTMKVDSRFNYMGSGIALLLLAMSSLGIVERILIVIFVGSFSALFQKVMAAGDLEALPWIGLVIMAVNPITVFYFFASLLIFVSLFHSAAFIAQADAKQKVTLKLPGYPFIMAAYLCTFLI